MVNASMFPAAVLTQASALLSACQQRGWTLAAAESCTGGLLLGCLTEIPGSSAVVLGGAVTYANSLKEKLGVPPDMIATYGAVSAPVAAAMAQRIQESCGATIGIAITGIAGPGGGSIAKPTGLVWFGIATPAEITTESALFTGDRSAVRLAAVHKALSIVFNLTKNA
jgi:nicotinamide-nucleotide amidase